MIGDKLHPESTSCLGWHITVSIIKGGSFWRLQNRSCHVRRMDFDVLYLAAWKVLVRMLQAQLNYYKALEGQRQTGDMPDPIGIKALKTFFSARQTWKKHEVVCNRQAWNDQCQITKRPETVGIRDIFCAQPIY